jgi:HK97 family phage prohead protease
MELDRRNLPPQVLARLAERLGPEFLTSRHPGFDINYKNKVLEQRVHRGTEARKSDTGEPLIVGYATVYDHAYDVLGGPPYGWSETIVGGAAAKSIAEQDEVYLFFDHEGLPLAATKDVSLELKSDKLGLYNSSKVDATSNWSMEVWNRVDQGKLDSMSFAFIATRQEWNADYTERFITEVKLFDVSVVSFPANPFTSVMARDDIAAHEVKAAFPLALAQHQADALRLACR